MFKYKGLILCGHILRKLTNIPIGSKRHIFSRIELFSINTAQCLDVEMFKRCLLSEDLPLVLVPKQ